MLRVFEHRIVDALQPNKDLRYSTDGVLIHTYMHSLIHMVGYYFRGSYGGGCK